MVSMRSQHVDYYNHDNLAPDYDASVQKADDPIREGYDQVLEWVIENAELDASTRVLELGSGTGNLTCRIANCKQITCVDISTRKEELAAKKLTHLRNRTFVASDVLEFVVKDTSTYDAIISTYTLHHLTEAEKMPFLESAIRRLSPGGRLIIGDLISKSVEAEANSIAYYRSIGDTETADDMEEEFFWYVDTAVNKLEDLGLPVETARFSRLSWCIKATQPA
jgi:putative AdoMet-dependent methyltransferase